MRFRLQQCHVSIGTTGWQPLAELVNDDYTVSLRFCLKFLVNEQIRGQKPRKVNSAQIDYNLLSTWIKKYTQQHEPSRCQPQAKPIPGFKVIDYRTRRVIKISERECQYVALSYVWGDAVPDDEDPQSYPPTIEDAITFTVTQGYHYLWVDRYVRATTNRDSNSVSLTMTTVHQSIQRRKEDVADTTHGTDLFPVTTMHYRSYRHRSKLWPAGRQ
jgi:hypothetical protein